MEPRPSSRCWISGDFHFDPSSGELRPAAAEGGEVVRLPPQPARLLELLVEKEGALLSREEIQAELWPDVHVDFDQGLNFCIHQVRNALGDTAGAPRYVETLPRRGYRLKEPARRVAAKVPPAARAKRHPRVWIVTAALVLLAVATWWSLQHGGAGTPPRLAITPFQPPTGVTVRGEPTRVAEALLLDLGNLGQEVLAVLGPATTSRYGGSFPELDRMAIELDLDYVINGRFIAPENKGAPEDEGQRSALLVELIRASDGAHVWVVSFEDASDTAAVAERIGKAVKDELGLASPSLPKD